MQKLNDIPETFCKIAEDQSNFFLSAFNFRRNANRPKLFGHPYQKIHSRLSKIIFMHLGQILTNLYRVLGGEGAPL